MQDTQEFPTIITRSDSLSDYIVSNKDEIETQLSRCGAILFRGFDVTSAEDFDDVVVGYGEQEFSYSGSLSNAVRINVTPRVFTANEAPSSTSIFLHHEMAQTPLYPSKLFFFCEIAPTSGGATPICRSDILLEKLTQTDADFVKKLSEKGVRYTNVMPPHDDHKSGQGRSWRSTLSVKSRKAAEDRLSKLGYRWQWVEDDSLRVTTPILDAVKTTKDNRVVFFNQLIAAFRGWQDSRNDPSKSICFGDGLPITQHDMIQAITIAEDISYDVTWQAGDVVLLDNFLVMHGRHPYSGNRRVLASLVA